MAPGVRRDLETAVGRGRFTLTQETMLATQVFGAQHGIGNSELAAYLHLVVAAQSGTPIRPTDLRDSLQLSGAAITYVIERLCDKGYIHRVPDPGDRRTYTVEVTKQGRDAVAESAVRSDRRIHAALRDLADDDIHAAQRVLAALTTAARCYRAELQRGRPSA